MELLLDVLEKLKAINNEYNNDINKIEELEKKIKESKVCVPIIGKFSTGKTALVNGMLDIRNTGVLKENITPETAVATEIVYSDYDDYIEINYIDGQKEKLSIREYLELNMEVERIKAIRIYINNSFLSEIKDVMLVDLPGFESGYDIHNKAIDSYVKNSMAYILAVSADDMIIRRSEGNILKELGMANMKICVAITKYDKVNTDFEETFSNLKENLKKYIGEELVEYSITSSRSGELDDIKSFLYKIQKQSGKIISQHYKGKVLYELDKIKSYLETRKKRIDLSESEFEEEKERLEREIDRINEKIYKERKKFEYEIIDSIEMVKKDLMISLKVNSIKFTTMIMNKQDIDKEINCLVRIMVRKSVEKNIIPKFKNYLSNIEKFIDENMIEDFQINIQLDEAGFKEEIISSIIAFVAGTLLGISIPVLGFIAAVSAKIVGNQKREEQKKKIEEKLNREVFPNIVRKVGKVIDISIREQVDRVNKMIEDAINDQKETVLKSIDDIKRKIEDEKEEKDKVIEETKNNLDMLERLRNELQ